MFLADQLKHDRRVAIEVLKPELAAAVASHVLQPELAAVDHARRVRRPERPATFASIPTASSASPKVE